MPKDKIKVLLIYNLSDSTFTAFPWMLACQGFIEVDVVLPDGHPVARSKWVRVVHSFKSNDEVHGLVRSLLESGRYASSLFIDESSRGLLLPYRNDSILAPYMPFPVDSRLNAACTNKSLFQNWCEEHDIPVPRSCNVSRQEDVSTACAEIGFPNIIKGATASRGSQVFVINDDEELLAVLSKHSEVENWLIQEYIVGQMGSTSFVCKGGIVYGFCSSYELVALGGGLGPSVLRHFAPLPEVERIVRKLVQVGNISGITGFDWIETENGDYKIVDPHLGRTPASVVVSHYDDVSIAQAFYASLTDGEPIGAPNGSRKSVWMMPQMLRLLFEGRLFSTLNQAYPWRKGNYIFWCGEGEYRVLWRVVFPYIVGQFRVQLGRLLRVIRGYGK